MVVIVRGLAKTLLFLILVVILAEPIRAIGFESFGPTGKHIGRSSDWPQGTEELLRHQSRVYWQDVNGSERAFYDGDINVLNELLEVYSQLDIPTHQAVIRPGRPSARSFRDKLTPYAVEFNLPGRFQLHHMQQYASTGLYALTPRLIIHVDDNLAENLNELRIPSDVSLLESSHRQTDAMKYIDSDDPDLRNRAIAVLVEAGDTSQELIDALNRYVTDGDNKYVREAAQRALKQIKEVDHSQRSTLQRRVAGFVRQHKQRHRKPERQELLQALRNVDAQYAEGFTAEGTLIRPTLTDPFRLVS